MPSERSEKQVEKAVEKPVRAAKPAKVAEKRVGPVIGIDLGGTNMQVGIVGADDKLLARAKRKTKAEEGLNAILDRIVQAIEECRRESKVRLTDLAGLGIGAPGAVDPHEGVVLEAVNLRWNDVPLAELLSDRLGIPCFVDNDVNAAIFGENQLGAGQQSDNVLGVWVGTGIGGGLILNRKLYYGHYLTAGEIGHMILFPNNPPGSRSLEHNCSRTAVVERVQKLMRANRKSSILEMVGGDWDKVRSKTLAKAYQDGDELAIEVVDDSADMLGVAIGSIVTLLSLERVVLGGGLTEAMGQPFVDRVQKQVRRYAFPDRCKRVQVVASELEDDAGLMGAAMIARDRISG
jgi:glucokinase